MKKYLLRSLLVLTGLTAALSATAADADCCKSKEKSACCGADKACCQAAPASVAPDTCVVSGDKLGDMGKPYEYIYKRAGQPDRTILLCCKGCVKDFEKEPAKYLKLLDEAAKAKQG